MAAHDPTSLRTAPLATPTGFKSDAVKDISGALNILLADMSRFTSKQRTSTGTSPVRIFATTI